MSKGTVVFSDAGVALSSTGGMGQYANGFTVNQDITLCAIEVKLSNGKPYSENVTIAIWDDTGKMISQSTKSIPQGTTYSWVSFGLTPIKLIAEREYVVGQISMGLGAYLSHEESLPKTIKSNTTGFDFTIKNSRRRYSDTYTPAPPVYGYWDIFDFKLIWDMNSNPTLSLTSPTDNQMLTENATLSIQGNASDIDKDNVVTVKYRVNNGTTRALQSGVSNGSTPLSFAKTLTFRTKRLYDGTTDLTGSDLAENTDHTLTIWAEDDQGGKSTEVTRKFRVVHNRPPVISGQNEDLGVLSTIPSKTYTVTEPEGDAFTITEKINGKIIRTFAGTASKENIVTIPLGAWLRLSLTAVHTLTIEATDSKGMTSIRTYTFRRSADKIAFALKKPFDTDIAAKRILVTIDATVPAGADYKVEVCNNAFDESPTWEDATNHVKFNRGFIFTNKEKTAEKWGVSLRFSFTKGTVAEPVIVRGFGGAFD